MFGLKLFMPMTAQPAGGVLPNKAAVANLVMKTVLCYNDLD
jgi:hypothetical protein